MDSVSQVQILDKSVYVSFWDNALSKSIYPSLPLQAKLYRLDFLALVMWPAYEKENSEFKPTVWVRSGIISCYGYHVIQFNLSSTNLPFAQRAVSKGITLAIQTLIT